MRTSQYTRQAVNQIRQRAADQVAIRSGRMPETVAIAAAAAFERAGIDPSRVFGETIANAAADLFGHGGGSIAAMCEHVLDCEGLPRPQNTPALIEAAGSTATGQALFQGVIDVALTQPFRASRDTTRGWTSQRQVDNFRSQQRPRIRHGERLSHLSRGQSADVSALHVQDAESYTASRFAKQFSVSEQDLVDDDTDALITPALALGLAARDLRNDLVYKILLENAAMADSIALFHADHSNLNTSVALSATNLDAAIASMRTQTENGRPVDVTPSFILVPPALEGLAKRLVRDMTTADDDSLAVRSEPRLSAGIVDPIDDVTSHAGSTTTWFLAAADAPTIEVGFIDSPTPQARITPLEMGRWGLLVDVKFDIGAKALDWRGLQRNDA